jgi:hypothetical protein
MNLSLNQIKSKFRGCLLGGLIGDCLGYPFENDPQVSKSVLTNYLQKILNDTKGNTIL